MATSNQEERPRSEILNMKFGDLKVFASTSFTRAKQVRQKKIHAHIYCIYNITVHS